MDTEKQKQEEPNPAAPLNAKRRHTLERIAAEMGSSFDEDKMHTALLLSYAGSIYNVLRKTCQPNTIHRIHYDCANNQVELDELMGMSLPPQPGSLDMSVVDEIFASNERDIPIVLEGETGVGKTFPATTYLSIVLQKDQFFSHRLSANAFLNNLFSPFQEGRMEKGMPVIEAKVDRIENCGAGLTDEINRGDSNETLQLFDNEMHLGGNIYKLGIPIPELKAGKLYYPGKKKKLLLVCAQNPAGTEDAKFTQTMQLDAAVDNRLLKVHVGNAAAAVGSSLWLGDKVKDAHKEFLKGFSKTVADYLQIPDSALNDIKEDWLGVYSWTTEAKRTDKKILYSSMELADLLVATFSGNLVNYFKYEQKVLKIWENKLKKGVTIDDTITETETIKKVQGVTESFKIPVIFRDIAQLKKIADVLSTLRNIKDSIRSNDPVDTYLNMEKHVTVREVSGAMSLLLRNKQPKEATAPVDTINSVLTSYVALTTKYMQDQKALRNGKFDIYDDQVGIKKVAVVKSIRDTVRRSNGVDYLVDQIAEHAQNLVAKISSSEDIKNIIIARSAADLMTLCGFLTDYKDEIDPIIKSYAKEKRISPIIERLGAFYQEKLDEKAMVMPDIYQQRIKRTLGE